MENIVAAVSNAATTVSETVTNAIYGTESNETGGTEPVSGQKGEGTATDPFDKGNDEKATAAADTKSTSTPSTTTSTSAPNPTSTSTSTSTSAPAMSSAPTSNPAATGPEGASRPDAGARSGDVRPTEANANDPSTSKAGGFGTAEPSVSADPASAPAPEAKQQGAGKPLDEPTGEQKEAVKDSKDAAEDGAKHPANDQEREKLAEEGKLPHDPNDHSGEPMKMHGSAEGAEGEDGSGEKKQVTEAERKASVGQEGGGEHGKEKGTGEQWVKTSGFEKDGGDFDATKPGAGKEATRLQEEKGIHHESGAPGDNSGSPAPGGEEDKKEKKVSTMDKIKDKLHLGTGKNLEGGK